MNKYLILFSLCLAVVSCAKLNRKRDYIFNIYHSNQPLTETQKYVYYENEVNWFKAFQICKGAGMDLASVLNADEHTTMGKAVADCLSPGKYAWLSGARTEHNDRFSWMNHTTPMNFSNWARDRPDSREHASCLLVGTDNKWYNGYCRDKRPFYCQRQN